MERRKDLDCGGGFEYKEKGEKQRCFLEVCVVGKELKGEGLFMVG